MYTLKSYQLRLHHTDISSFTFLKHISIINVTKVVACFELVK